VFNKKPCSKDIRIRVANGAIMQATHEAKLNFRMLPSRARRIYIVPKLAYKTLMSISQLCDAGCQVTFDTNTVQVYHKGEVVLTGSRMKNVALWQMDRPITTRIVQEHYASAVIHFNTMAEIVRFSQSALGFPTIATLDKALANGWITCIPGLTQATLRKHPPFSDATVKGHMTQARKNVKSTKKLLPICDGEGRKTAKTNSQNHEETNVGPSMECSKPTTSSMEPVEWERSHSSETTHTAKPGPSMESGKTPTSSNEQVETKPAHSSKITQKCETQPMPNEQSERDPQNHKSDDSKKGVEGAPSYCYGCTY
jgi:hypothetical protein